MENESAGRKSYIVIVSPSDTGYKGRCKTPLTNDGCLITPEEKQKCANGVFCCYFSELFSDYKYYCHKDVWYRFVSSKLGNVDYVLFCYLSPQKELVASGLYTDVKAGSAYRDISSGTFDIDAEGDYYYIYGDISLSLKFPYDIVLPKLNTLSQAGFIRSLSCNELLKVLEKAVFVSNNVGTSEASVLEKLETVVTDLREKVPPESENEFYSRARVVTLSPWLQELMDSIEIPKKGEEQFTARELQDKASSGEDPIYLLQAAALQLSYNDYKYVLSLANYCYYNAHQKRSKGDFSSAKESYVEAVKLYRHDPVNKRWKDEYINRCISEFVKIVTREILEGDDKWMDFNRFFPRAWEMSQIVSPFVSSDLLGKQIESTYYNYRLETIWDNKNDIYYIEYFDENVLNSPIVTELRSSLVARYYQLVAKQAEQEYTSEKFLLAAQYREKASQVQRANNRRMNNVSADEDMVEYYKDCALAAYLENDIPGFIESIDQAINKAKEVNETEPNRRRLENVYYLEGLKYNNLARSSGFDETIQNQPVFSTTPPPPPIIEQGKPESLSERIQTSIDQINELLTGSPERNIFIQAHGITENLVELGVDYKAGADADTVEAYQILNKSLKYCLSESVPPTELWEFVYNVGEFKKRIDNSGDNEGLFKVAESTIAWHLSSFFSGSNDVERKSLFENIHRMVKAKPIVPVRTDK